MYRRIFFVLLTMALVLASACQDEGGSSPGSQTTAGQEPAQVQLPPEDAGSSAPSGEDSGALSPTPASTTPTPEEPLAAVVNGQPITLVDYEKELSRYEQAQAELGLNQQDGSNNYREIVLNALIETELIAQAATANGLSLTDSTIDQRLAQLQEESGGESNFAAWLQANQWTLQEFRQALADEMLTKMAMEMVTGDVPTAVEQVRARYLQVDDQALALNLLEQVRGGADFGSLARQYSLDRITGEGGGDLGFFSRGTLLVPAIEEAAFALQPGEVSEIIQVDRSDGGQTTYYLVQVLERDPQRQLTPDVLSGLLQQRFEAWLAELWSQAEIVRLVDTSG